VAQEERLGTSAWWSSEDQILRKSSSLLEPSRIAHHRSWSIVAWFVSPTILGDCFPSSLFSYLDEHGRYGNLHVGQ
jgi:hypothetical protein